MTSSKKRIFTCDIETNDLDNPTEIWCTVLQDVDTEEVFIFTHDEYHQELCSSEKFFLFKNTFMMSELAAFCEKNVDMFVGHNFIAFDGPKLKDLAGINIPTSKIYDTLVVSRLVQPKRQGGHSLEGWGYTFGFPKIHFEEFDKFSVDMVEYCVRDVELNTKVYHHLKKQTRAFSDFSVRLEHQTQDILVEMKNNGFKLDIEKAHCLLAEIEGRCNQIQQEIKDEYGLKQVFDKKAYWLRRKKDGNYNANAVKFLEERNYVAFSTAPEGEKEKFTQAFEEAKQKDERVTMNDFVLEYYMEEFNIASSTQVRERMEEAGWQPVVFNEPTKRMKDEGIEQGSAVLCEENFNTLPEDAPQSAKKIAYWMTLISRVRTIKQWFQALNEETGCVHGSVVGIGAQTHRMAHRAPNMANIAKVATAKDDKGEEHLVWGEEGLYKTDMRDCWVARGDDRCIVGVDLSGIQLRAFAHYANNEEYMRQILEGDIHSYNQGILQEIIDEYAAAHPRTAAKDIKVSRGNAKTFIYAYLFGAGNQKVGDILGFPKAQQMKAGKFVKEGFAQAISGLDDFKAEIKKAAKRGWMQAIDGRLIQLPSEHQALSIYLQSFETIIMRYAIFIARKRIRKEGLDWKLVAVVHDEMQIDALKKDAERIGQIVVESMQQAGKDLGSRIPLDGEAKIGSSWAYSH